VLRLEDDWVWDSWPTVDGDTRHLFFLHAPRSLGDPQLRHRNARIGHARSTDLRSWTRLPDVVAPGADGAFDEVACWTGCTVRGPDGRWQLFYTGVTDVDHVGGPNRQRIGVAVSDDLITWTKADVPIVEADPRWYEVAGETEWRDETWRDPWVLPDARGDGWHMLVTARANAELAGDRHLFDRGLIGHAHSSDLQTWTVLPPLSAPGAGFGQLEVPQVFEHAGRAHLVFSCLASELRPERRTTGVTGGHWIVPDVDPVGPYDIARAVRLTGDDWYAGRLQVDRAGQPVLLAFANRDASGAFGGVIGNPVPIDIPDPDRRTS
jgi:beta-fructofuranosidase